METPLSHVCSLADLHKIYTSNLLSATHNVRSLQRKVQWDIRYYFARRGAENIHAMTKDTFKMTTDRNNGIRYIVKAVDEETKNHKETDKDIVSAFMPEMRDSIYCPVSSFMRYLNALSKKSNKLWQTAKFTEFPKEEIGAWFYGKMGHNKLDTFVSDICELMGLEKRYTNHSLRVTAITNLTKDNYNNKQIMSITGHKSSTSLEIYQRVHSDEKIAMGYSLAESMTKENIPQKIAPKPKKRPASSTSPNPEYDENAPPAKQQLVEVEVPEDFPEFNISNDEIIKLVEECEKSTTTENMALTQNINTGNVTLARSPQFPGFTNCKIGHITINFNKM